MAIGRMLNRTVAFDQALNSVSVEAHLLFIMTIPHLDRDGLIVGEPLPHLGIAMPLRPNLFARYESIIDELINAHLVIRYPTRSGRILFFPGFNKNQKITYNREGTSVYEAPPGYQRTENGLVLHDSGAVAESLRSHSGVTQELVVSNSGVTHEQYTLKLSEVKEREVKESEIIALAAPLAAQPKKQTDTLSIPHPYPIDTLSTQNGKVNEPLPVETTPTPKPVKAKKEKPVQVEETQPTGQQEMFGALCQIVLGHSTYTALSGKNKAQLGTESSNLLKIGATPELVASWYKEKWRSGWPGKNGTAPSFEQVRNGVAAYIESFTLPSVVDTVLSFDLEDVINA